MVRLVMKILIALIVNIYILFLSLLNDNFDLNYYYYYHNEYSNYINCLVFISACVLFLFFTRVHIVIGLWAVG
jgi:hypothetical protein